MKKFTTFESRMVPLAVDNIDTDQIIPARCLGAQKLTLPGGREIEFPVDRFSKQCLLEGVDELGYILAQESAIAAYEATRQGSLNTLA